MTFDEAGEGHLCHRLKLAVTVMIVIMDPGQLHSSVLHSRMAAGTFDWFTITTQ